MIQTAQFYIYKTSGPLDITTQLIPFGELDERSQALFFDAQDDIERAGLDLSVLEENEEYRQGLAEFLEQMEGAEDQDEVLNRFGMDEVEIEFVTSGEALIGYVISDAEDPDITYVASFLPLPRLSSILYGVPAKAMSSLPFLGRRRKGVH